MAITPSRKSIEEAAHDGPTPGTSASRLTFSQKWGDDPFTQMGHTQVPNALVEYAARLGLKSEECWLICCVLRFKYSADNPRPTQETLARLFGQSVDTVQRTVKKIMAKNLLKVERARSDGGTFTHTIYDFTPLRFALNECYYQDHPQDRPKKPIVPQITTPQNCGMDNFHHTAELRPGPSHEPGRNSAARTTPQNCGPNKKTEQQEEKKDSSRATFDQRPNSPDTSVAAVRVEEPEEDKSLVAYLREHGVNRADAVRLVNEEPDECRRQLEYLPFVTAFKTSKGAYLRSAIEQGFGPPSAYIKARQRQEHAHEQTTGAAADRAAMQRKRREALVSSLRGFAAQMELEQPEAFSRFTAYLEGELHLMMQRFSARAAQESYRKLYSGEAKRLERFATYFAANPCPLPALAAWLVEHPPLTVAALLQDGR